MVFLREPLPSPENLTSAWKRKSGGHQLSLSQWCGSGLCGKAFPIMQWSLELYKCLLLEMYPSFCKSLQLPKAWSPKQLSQENGQICDGSIRILRSWGTLGSLARIKKEWKWKKTHSTNYEDIGWCAQMENSWKEKHWDIWWTPSAKTWPPWRLSCLQDKIPKRF